MSEPEEPMVGGRFYHVRVRKGEVAPYVLMPGDPDRVPKLAKFWDEASEVSFHREYRVWNGRVGGARVTACSTGIGAPSTIIALEELARAGANTFIRVGSTGALQRGIELGDLIISEAAVRLEGTSTQYALKEYPAYASYEVTLALIEAAETIGAKYHVGVTASTDSFYTGQGRKGYQNYTWSHSEKILQDLKQMQVLNFEMEASALFTVASIYRLRAGAVCTVFANREEGKFGTAGEETLAKVAAEAVKILNEWDTIKQKNNKKHIYPSMLLKHLEKKKT
ncbi:MAG TPA: uridine phosphorylase [Candidatus Caldiarchaeum subterraneum]|uniref:Uridine phosphorylase n=1 Tax=Caldiarchaeum subterraneum TaxID=311458 RepID=A0A832ZW74_CALS0|nr:uridine phosphorylase [Aigarchaeota archaeon]HIQ29437.1 uridine phosphorylase [Candidatus Caldarchaeum subterraneum]